MSDSLWLRGLQHAGFPLLCYLPELAQTHVHWVSDTIQPSHPLSSFLPLPSVFPGTRDFSSESALQMRWPKYWSFGFSPSNEYSGLISFKRDWFDLLALQGNFKSLLQHHSLKASIIWCSAFFMFQLSHLYITTRKTKVLTRWTCVARCFYCKVLLSFLRCCLGLSLLFFQGVSVF